MFILKSVVGKLWMTIIGLVAFVLLILSLFWGQYIQTYFAKTQDQTQTLLRLSTRVAAEVIPHLNEPKYLQTINELLSAQDAKIILLDTKLNLLPMEQKEAVKVDSLFPKSDLQSVLAGQSIDNHEQVKMGSKDRLESEYLAVAVPLKAEGQSGSLGALVLYQTVQSLESTQAYVKRLFAYVGVMGFLLTTFFAFFLSTRITQPLLQLKKAADLITLGEYGTRVPITSSDELGELAKTFNHMGEELEDTIKALNHEKEHLASVLRSMIDAVITFDAEGHVILTNPQGEKIVQEWSLIGLQEGETPPVNRQTIPKPMQQLFEAVVAEASEMNSKLHVRNEVWSIVMAPLYSRDVVRGAVAVLRDVTEEHRMDKLRKDFVANVSHELRTPLSMLQGYSEALLDDIAASPEERKELAQVIHDESLRMGRLVNDLLDLARMENGNMVLNFREVEVGTFIKRIYRKFAVLAKEQEIALAYELPELPLVLEQADEDRLEQVMTNLLDNAFRHTSGGAAISIKAEQVLHKDADAIQIDISDQGHGIPPEDLPYVFERFYKADKARTRGVTGGTGLGLAIVKNIVDAHQGNVVVRSTLGQGTTFSIILPCKKL
ncbi:ATP-binding protein [Paenibacillus thalictri]|uniref:histidine kinase n=1 Tax=Paenibacillus thalictri TaxID=2527873 RepID=A0A4Q9DSD4_9BACL|nr:ATP-binding protein [Paenibacillus thalictri]TBL79784.1 HAMP domain-containing protein [Paenibacillus thalictri]